jgi:hypothetical protein
MRMGDPIGESGSVVIAATAWRDESKLISLALRSLPWVSWQLPARGRTERMSRPAARFRLSVRKTFITLLAVSCVSVSVRAVANEKAEADVPPSALERSITVEARRLAISGWVQSNGNINAVHRRNWAGRHPVLLGALIGLGVGVSADAIQCVAPESGDNGLPCDARVAAFFGGLFAGIGAGVGAVVAIFLR